jgi:zinc/manganese transport system permease protein
MESAQGLRVADAAASLAAISATISAILFDPFAEFGFMRRALAGCLALSLGSAPVGVILMLRRMSLTGDAMAHAILPGAAVGYLVAGLSLSAMTLGGVVAGLLVTLTAAFVARSSRQSEDSSLAAFFLLSLSVGVVIVSTGGSSVDLLHVLFGSVLALDDATLYLLGAIASFSLIVLALLYRPLVFECVNPGLMPRHGRWSVVAHQGFMMLLVLNLVAGFHALGTLMSVGIMILPAAAARFWVREFNRLIALSVAVALAGSVAGLLLSYHLEWPTGPTIVLTLGVCYCVSLLAGAQGIVTASIRPRRHYRA